MELAKSRLSVFVRSRVSERRGRTIGQTVLVAGLATLLLLTFLPMIYLLILSLKDNGQIYGRFWSLPNPVRWYNYISGARVMGPYILNTLVVTVPSLLGTLTFASLSAYVFARHQFPGKDIIYVAFLALMMIPGIVTLIPSYVLLSRLNLVNTRWALILPWMAGGQVFGILLLRTFFEGLSTELFEAGKIDGATELQLYSRIALPLSKPSLITLAIMRTVTTYNAFTWPLIVISDPKMQVVSVGATQFTSSLGITDLGPQMAAYVIAALPLLILFLFGMRYYIRGLTAGALKA
jgi:ABC-type glycerol-3-phosphate transport system permease component